MREITVTARDGRVSQLEQVYIRGSMVSQASRCQYRPIAMDPKHLRKEESECYQDTVKP